MLYHPKQTKEQHDRGEQPKSELLIEATPILAGSEDEVAIIAARNIPADHLGHLDGIETIVRPF